MMKFSFGSAAAVAATALVLTSCGAPEDSATNNGSNNGASAASGTGTLNIACSQQEIFCQKMSQAFEDETGIETTYVRLGAGEVIARLKTNQGEFDVWSGGQAENHLVAHEDGNIEPYISDNAAALPAEYNDEEGLWTGFYTDSIGFCSNQDELDRLGVDAPTSWDDLLKPEFAGQISMPHPATAGVGYMIIYTLHQLYGGDDAKVLEYLSNLDNNVVQYSKSAATGTQMAGRGEAAVGIALDSDCVMAQEEGFSNLEYTYPEEGTGYEVGAVSLLKGAPNTEEAQRYFDWIVSAEAQNLYPEVPTYAAPTHPDAVLGEGIPDQNKVNKVDWDVADAAARKADLNGLFESRIASSEEAAE
ncbi:ABC transporter substrate-binding protein [Corynebacterium sp.]|uniref:ABC transporter substrate-binding protein n=1 Tax=Corynebacterium sp. TaxID=1720 RepID=UPI0026E05278|nr:ABC transporter substrate-binding protein [Corynebacterium sp.]